jgi:branched-chain amino acid transport system ATP-binding protein
VNRLVFDGIEAGYGLVRVLHGVSLEVREGEIVVLLGANGNGKSTLIKSLFGLVQVSRGRITLERDGRTVDLTGLETEAVTDLGIVLVPEGRRLFPELTVEENLVLGSYRPAARRLVRDNLALCYGVFPVLAARRRQRAGSMSGGEQQMVALGRALMSAPRMLVIDEPSVGLSPLFVKRTIQAIGDLRRSRDLSVLMAEQNFKQAMRIADRGYVLEHGQVTVVADGPEALTNSEVVRRAYLGL